MSIQDYNKKKQADQLQDFSDRVNLYHPEGVLENHFITPSPTKHITPEGQAGLFYEIDNPLPIVKNICKILVIGQAPPAKKQKFPYHTTQLYDWLAAIGVSLEGAQIIFEFEALVPAFTGRNNTNSGHKKPGKAQVIAHWPVLEEKLQSCNKVLLLGAVAAEWYDRMPRTWSCDTKELYLLHPSRRNIFKFRQNKETILSQLKDFVYE